MKKITLILALLLITICGNAQIELPNPTSYVSDFGKLLSDSEKSELNEIISAYEKQTGVEICILTIESLNGYDIESFSQEVFKQWKIGKESSDNGILIAVSLNDHKWRIQTGYGAEILLPDAICSEIGQNNIVPNFKNNNYYLGLKSTVDAIKNNINKNSAEDIEAFKLAEIKKQQVAHDKMINILYGILIIILSIIALAFLISTWIKIKDKRKEQLLKANETYNNIRYFINIISRTNNKELNLLIDEYNEYIKTFIIPQPNYKNYNELKLIENQLITKYNKINMFNKSLINLTQLLNDLPNYTNKIIQINNIAEELSKYNDIDINSFTYIKGESDIKQYLKINEDISNMDIINIDKNINNIKAFISYVDEKHSRVIWMKNNIETRLSTVKCIDSNIKNLRQQLINNDLKCDLDKFDELVNNAISNQKSGDENIIFNYSLFEICKSFVDKQIQDKQYKERQERERLERIEREKKRKKEQEEEDRRRNSYNSYSLYSSYSSSSFGSDSSSSFGGFGGGDSGGGGASGSW